MVVEASRRSALLRGRQYNSDDLTNLHGHVRFEFANGEVTAILLWALMKMARRGIEDRSRRESNGSPSISVTKPRQRLEVGEIALDWLRDEGSKGSSKPASLQRHIAVNEGRDLGAGCDHRVAASHKQEKWGSGHWDP